MRKEGLPLQRLLGGDALATLAQRPALRRRLRRCTPRSGRATSRRSPSSSELVAVAAAAPRAPSRTSPRASDPDAASPAPRRSPGDPGVVVKGAHRRVGQAGQVLHPGARRRRSSGSSPAATACRCTAPTAPTLRALQARARAAWSRSSGRRAPGRCSWWRSRSRRSTGTGCCPTSPGCSSDQHVNILSASVTTTRDRVAVSRFTFEMGDPKHLGHLLRRCARRGRLRRLPGHLRRLTPPHCRSRSRRRPAAPRR